MNKFIISYFINLKSRWTGISGYFVPRAIWEVEVSSVTLGTAVSNHHNRSFTAIAISPNVPWIWDYYAFRNHGQLKTMFLVNLTCGACGLDTAATMNSFIPNRFRNCNKELFRHRAKFWETAISPMRLRRVNGDISWRFWSLKISIQIKETFQSWLPIPRKISILGIKIFGISRWWKISKKSRIP